MDKRRRPRALTLTLPHGKQPYLMLQNRKYTLRNFSEEGIGLWIPTPLPFGLNKGAKISGDIVIDSNIYPVKLEIMHVSKRMAGLKIVHRSKDLKEIFAKLLEPAHYAASLALHLNAGAPSNEEAPKLWYEGDAGVELVIWYNELQKVVLALQLVWLGKWAFREQFKVAKTGYLSDEPRKPEGRRLKGHELLIQHENPDAEILMEACHFLSCVNPPLPGHLLWQFLETGEQVFLPDLALLKTGTD